MARAVADLRTPAAAAPSLRLGRLPGAGKGWLGGVFIGSERQLAGEWHVFHI
jgi:hypothetical protein